MWSPSSNFYARTPVREPSFPTPLPYRLPNPYQTIRDPPTPPPSPPYYRYNSASYSPPPRQPMPAHMRLDSWPSTPFPLNKICEIFMKVCCLICYGRRDLQEAWDAGEDGERWAVFKDRYTDRISQLNIVVSVHVPCLFGPSLV